ncbi:AAA family ATPase [Microbispora sp. NPDC049125]|uniref:AAA family ATPase n=1 Tax=Microbispora sp. NPDC049125 TaxID=3154929 RepID=UPI00346716EF
MTDDAALRALREAARLSPDNPPLRRHLADLLLAAGHLAEAEAEFQAALVLAPADPAVVVGLARTFVLQGKSGAALMALEAVLRTSSPPPPAALVAAEALLAEGDVAGASARYREATALDPALTDPEFEALLDEAVSSSPAEAAPASQPSPGPAGAPPAAQPSPDHLDPRTGPASSSPDPAGSPLTSGPRAANPRDGLPYAAEPAAELERSGVTFADVAGMDAVKEALRMKLLLPIQRPELFAAYGKRAGGGVLLYGPPGAGKTHLARAAAGELGASFVNVGLADILDMWVGSSERNLSATFALARRSRPCVLFFDEVDALAARRTDMRQAHGRQVVNQFLAELDGVDDRANEGVLVLAATNAPWYIDVAFRRPGRFDQMVFVPPPDLAARAAILSILCRGKPLAGVDYAKVARATEGYAGADLKGLVDRAVEAKLGESIRAGRPLPLSTQDLLAAARTVRPTAVREWLGTARNYVLHSNESGVWDDLLPWIRDL